MIATGAISTANALWARRANVVLSIASPSAAGSGEPVLVGEARRRGQGATGPGNGKGRLTPTECRRTCSGYEKTNRGERAKRTASVSEQRSSCADLF